MNRYWNKNGEIELTYTAVESLNSHTELFDDDSDLIPETVHRLGIIAILYNGTGSYSQIAWVQILALPFSSCVILSKPTDLSELHSSNL